MTDAVDRWFHGEILKQIPNRFDIRRFFLAQVLDDKEPFLPEPRYYLDGETKHEVTLFCALRSDEKGREKIWKITIQFEPAITKAICLRPGEGLIYAGGHILAVPIAEEYFILPGNTFILQFDVGIQ